MTVKTWQTIKVQYCHHVDMEVGLEAEVVYPLRMAARPTATHPGASLLPWHGVQPGRPRQLRLGRHEPGLRSFRR